MFRSRLERWMCVVVLILSAGSASAQTLRWDDAGEIVLRGSDASRQLLVSENERDVTRDVIFETSPAGIVEVDVAGLVTPRREGKTVLTAKRKDNPAITRTVEVVGFDEPIHFINDIAPIFFKLGCNGGGCHGKTGGQNGFALSLFGFEPLEDYESIVKEARGRRLFPAAPEQSHLLKKATGAVAHAGGKRLAVQYAEYRRLRRWIAEGTPLVPKSDSPVTRIEVSPRERILKAGESQQLAVIAHRADGTSFDVTRLSLIESNDADMATVTADGLVTAKNRVGLAGVMVRYQTHADVFAALVPLGEKVAELPPAKNFIDELVFARLKDLGLPPSKLTDDATFLRRVTLDLASRLPTIEETKGFLSETGDDRHDRLVDRLLASPEYADTYANVWNAVLRNRRKSDKDDGKANLAFHKWIRQAMLDNVPYDRFVRDVVAVAGPHTEKPAVLWYREVGKINDQVEDVAQLYLGQRIACARCHHHPLEKWSQRDYWGMASFFSRVDFQAPPAPKVDKKDKDKPPPPTPPMTVAHKPGKAQALNPKTGKMVGLVELGGNEVKIADDADPREKLVDWMTDAKNPYFAKALVNRYWKRLMGRGLVEPEDDLRATNPPTNPALLDALARSFTESGYDLKKLVRTICTSSAYRLSAEPNAHNTGDRQNYSRFSPRRMTAEVLLDAIDDVTLSRSNFKGVAGGTRAVQLPDNQADSYFLSVFGRPDFATACECERSGDSNLAQSLHLVNSLEIAGKIAKGRLPKMLKDKRPHAEKIRELYLIAYSREASDDEVNAIVSYLERNAARIESAYEDVFWAVLNSKEFLFNH